MVDVKSDPYAWHKAAMRGEKPPVHSEPECGWFLRPNGKIGAEKQWLPASIYWEPQICVETGERIGDDILRCEIGGTLVDPVDTWIWLAKRPIAEAEYMERTASLFRNYVEAL